METAHFSHIRSEIISLLDDAKREVLVAMAWFTSSELFSALLSCCNRGVRVNLILLDDPINYMYYAPDFNELIKHGGNLRIAGSDIGFMHHKFCVIDNHVVITGSYNWTYYAETRNIENVVITTDSKIVKSYTDEYNRLVKAISPTKESPRLSWAEIEQREDISFSELNYEIDSICKSKSFPVRKIAKTQTVVQIIESKLIPYSSCHIGVYSVDENKRDFFSPLIEVHKKLPLKSETQRLYHNSKLHNSLNCQFICGCPQDPKEDWQTIETEDLSSIVRGTCDINVPIDFTMQLDINGSLRIDVSCPISGQTMMISILNKDFVTYE